MIVLLWGIMANLHTGHDIMNELKKIWSLSLFFFLGINSGFSQMLADTSDIFINGWGYSIEQAANGHPYVFSKIWQYGSIESELGTRSNYLMNYDAYQDKLIIQTFRNNYPVQIVLNPRYIKSFVIDEHVFFNPKNLPGYASVDIKGYYELVYDGELKYIIKRAKKLVDEGNLKGMTYQQDLKTFIVYEGKLYTLKNKRSLYRIFPEQKKEISRFMRDSQIILKSANIAEIAELLKFIERSNSEDQ